MAASQGTNSPLDKTEEKMPQLWVEPAFGKNGIYPDCYEPLVILKHLTKLVSQQQVYFEGENPFSTRNESCC